MFLELLLAFWWSSAQASSHPQLERPGTPGAIPVAVILIPPDRAPDDLILANAIAHGLLGAGVSVVRLDVAHGSSAADIAARAAAVATTVRGQQDVDPQRVGVIGIGAAGTAVPLAAERDGRAAFLVTVSTSLVAKPDPLATWSRLRVPSLVVFRASDAHRVPTIESIDRLIQTRLREPIEVRVLGESADAPASVAEIVTDWVVKRLAAPVRPPKLRR